MVTTDVLAQPPEPARRRGLVAGVRRVVLQTAPQEGIEITLRRPGAEGAAGTVVRGCLEAGAEYALEVRYGRWSREGIRTGARPAWPAVVATRALLRLVRRIAPDADHTPRHLDLQVSALSGT